MLRVTLASRELLLCLRQHAPHATHAGFLVRNRLTAEEAHLPGNDVIRRMRSRRPLKFRFDIGERVARRQGGISLIGIDQGLELVHGRRPPSFPATNGLGCTTRN